MKKISLRPETLRVESFTTVSRPGHRGGTVHGAGASDAPGCESQGLTGCGSCGHTDCLAPSCGPGCEPTLAYSCAGSCLGETCDAACVMTADTCLLSCPDC